MSTAQDLRTAAITNEQPFGVDWEVMEMFIVQDNNEYRLYSDADDLTHRTFLLFVAEALDGGERNACEWTYDDDEYFYNTQCGEIFWFTADGPRENNFMYCCYCGGKVKETK